MPSIDFAAESPFIMFSYKCDNHDYITEWGGGNSMDKFEKRSVLTRKRAPSGRPKLVKYSAGRIREASCVPDGECEY